MSDTQRNARKLKKQTDSMLDEMSKGPFSMPCPKCHEDTKVYVGLNACEHCGHEFNLEL